MKKVDQLSETTYYQRNRDVILNRAKDYYKNDKERLTDNARDKYRNLSEEKKQTEYGRNREISEKKKQKLKEYQKNYCEVSSNVNEVIRPVLDFFFTIRFHKYKKALKSTKKH